MERRGHRGRPPRGLRPTLCARAAGHVPSRPVVLGAQVHHSPSRPPLWRHKLIFNMKMPQSLLHLRRMRAGQFSDVSSSACAVPVCLARPGQVTSPVSGQRHDLTRFPPRVPTQSAITHVPRDHHPVQGLRASWPPSSCWGSGAHRGGAWRPWGQGCPSSEALCVGVPTPLQQGRDPARRRRPCRQKFQGPRQEGSAMTRHRALQEGKAGGTEEGVRWSMTRKGLSCGVGASSRPHILPDLSLG